MDSNELVEFPTGCLLLPELKNLWIRYAHSSVFRMCRHLLVPLLPISYFHNIQPHRQNKISQLPHNLELMASLQVLSLSSNLLEELPEAVAGLHSLRQLFANGNRIKKVPENLCLLPDLKVRS